ncbi:FtsH protease activity modulator HflK [Pelagibius marinus]|uniref:FtsH protease activity modulator HflK n=1 Tax=Pelagibius marinus TaxID=2762760 RepID=UPI0018728116|nr:FtsH protease activity modulator HflK [Pelagibius marinus]
MPWENKGGGGGPWGGGGGSGGSGGGGPWGRGGGGQGGGPRPPDFEDFIKKGQDRFRTILPGGSGGLGPSAWLLIAIVVVLAWGLTGLYRVQTNEQGVVLQFGKWVETTEPGLNWHLPWPIESALTPSVTSVQQIDIGFVSSGNERARASRRDVEQESLMLTGDQNIIDIDFTVQWKIADAGQYLFNIRDPEATVKIAAESAMREIIGRTDIQPALTEARGTVAAETRTLLQATLNEYEAGIEITELALQDVQPPRAVIDAFNDVLRAQQDRDRARNEADRYRNDILPRARGDALRVVQEAEAYKEQLENEAEGEAQRFLSVFNAYKQNPGVTRRRMYLETLQDVLSDTDKVILDRQGGGGAIPYLPLNELRGRSGSTGSGSGN